MCCSTVQSNTVHVHSRACWQTDTGRGKQVSQARRHNLHGFSPEDFQFSDNKAKARTESKQMNDRERQFEQMEAQIVAAKQKWQQMRLLVSQRCKGFTVCPPESGNILQRIDRKCNTVPFINIVPLKPDVRPFLLWFSVSENKYLKDYLTTEYV